MNFPPKHQTPIPESPVQKSNVGSSAPPMLSRRLPLSAPVPKFAPLGLWERERERGDLASDSPKMVTCPSATAVTCSPPGRKRNREADDEAYLDNFQTHRRYLGEVWILNFLSFFFFFLSNFGSFLLFFPAFNSWVPFKIRSWVCLILIRPKKALSLDISISISFKLYSIRWFYF